MFSVEGFSPADGEDARIVADVDDENIVAKPALMVYHPYQQMGVGGRVFVRTSRDPYALVLPIAAMPYWLWKLRARNHVRAMQKVTTHELRQLHSS